MFWNYLKLIIFESICFKVQIYWMFNSKIKNKILKFNPKKMHMLMCTFNETGVKCQSQACIPYYHSFLDLSLWIYPLYTCLNKWELEIGWTSHDTNIELWMKACQLCGTTLEDCNFKLPTWALRISGPNTISYLNWTHIFEWWMIRWKSKKS